MVRRTGVATYTAEANVGPTPANVGDYGSGRVVAGARTRALLLLPAADGDPADRAGATWSCAP